MARSEAPAALAHDPLQDLLGKHSRPAEDRPPRSTATSTSLMCTFTTRSSARRVRTVLHVEPDRAGKRELLQALGEAGFYLMDLSPDPLQGG